MVKTGALITYQCAFGYYNQTANNQNKCVPGECYELFEKYEFSRQCLACKSFWERASKICVDACQLLQAVNETYRACEEPGSDTCKKYYISKQVKYCLNECSNEYPRTSSSDPLQCVKNCEEREQVIKGVCTKCQDNEWWDRKTGICKESDTTCEYYNSTYLICEQKDDEVNCPLKDEKRECYKDCTYIKSDDASVCLSYCPEAYNFITISEKNGAEVKVCNPQCETEFHGFFETRTNSQGEEYEIYVCQNTCEAPSIFGSVTGSHSKYCAASCA